MTIKTVEGKSFIRTIYFYIAFALLILTNGAQIVFGYNDVQAYKHDTDVSIQGHEKRILKLEDNSNKILYRIDYNLRQMRGKDYVENPPIVGQ